MTPKLASAAILFTVGAVLCTGALAQQTQSAKPQSSSSSSHHQAAEGKGSSASAVLDSEKAKASYAIGMTIGHNLSHEKVEIDPALFMRGLTDAIAGNKLLLTDQEARGIIMTIEQEARARQDAEMKTLGEANTKAGEAFLAANKTKAGVVTLPSGLQYKIIKQGTGPKPVATDTVVCNYRGTLINGSEFDSSYKRGKPVTFPVGGVIKGWTEVLQLMPVGSNYQVFIPSELAYGPRPASAEIGPNATLIFNIELLSIKEKPADAKAPGGSKPDHAAK